MTPHLMQDDTFRDEPTRPDLPLTVARPCVHCGKVYGDHAKGIRPRSLSACKGLRRAFAPAAHGEADASR